ncbi:MAG TPA: VOC family protein [Dongiaceae bacterium]|nr:VOC family protein [Dongiaceae bacterium]
MLDHLSLGVRDLGRALAFFDATFAPLGFRRQHDNANEASYGPGSDRTFWLYPIAAGEQSSAAGMHVAFAAPNRKAVDAACQAAVKHGATMAREPAHRPENGPNYYGTVVVDPDGHRLEILCSAPG